jgi:hypothetical protein
MNRSRSSSAVGGSNGVVAAGIGALLCGLWLASTAGCGSSGSSGPSAAQACADVAGKRCTQRSACSLPPGTTGSGFSLLENYGDLATCLARETLNCSNGLMAPGTGNSPTKVEACAGEFNDYTCQAYFDNQPPSDCAVTGSRADGAACTFNGQCTSGYCLGTKTSVCGTCAEPPAVGADCSASACGAGQRCLAATQQCVPVVALNGSCDATHLCDRGLSCFGADATTNTPGSCQTAGTQVGQACGGTIPGCDPTLGLYCGGATGAKTCQLVVYGGAGPDGGASGADAGTASGGATPTGTPCGVLADGTHVGCVAGGCYTATGPATGSDLGTCFPFAADHAACDSNLGPDCMLPDRCVASGAGTAGSCLIPDATTCPAS